MKQFGGWCFPDHEQHLLEWMRNVNDVADGRQRYQGTKQLAALSYCKQFRTAVDVGAHIGLWSYYLAKRFETVHAFEPVADHRQCFEMNMAGLPVRLHPCALGDENASVSIHTSHTSSGDSWVNGDGDIPMRCLDDFDLQDVDFIKIDCEGWELRVIQGARDTIARCRPVIIVEQKSGRAQKFGLPETGAVQELEAMGAALQRQISGDYIMTFEGARQWPNQYITTC